MVNHSKVGPARKKCHEDEFTYYDSNDDNSSNIYARIWVSTTKSSNHCQLSGQGVGGKLTDMMLATWPPWTMRLISSLMNQWSTMIMMNR